MALSPLSPLTAFAKASFVFLPILLAVRGLGRGELSELETLAKGKTKRQASRLPSGFTPPTVLVQRQFFSASAVQRVGESVAIGSLGFRRYPARVVKLYSVYWEATAVR